VSDRIWTPSSSGSFSVSERITGMKAASAVTTSGRSRPRAIQRTNAMKSSGASGNM
jgi:hypothetical protein